MRLVVHESPPEVAANAARRIAGLIRDSSGRFSLGLAGGGTPRDTYQVLRTHDIQWSLVDAWLSDERWVPHHDERCNGLMAEESLLDHVDAAFHRPQWSDSVSPEEAAARYEKEVRSIFRDGRADLVLLGMGADGHTASLFPETAALDERERWIVANEVPDVYETRITATYPLLWAAHTVLFLVTGEHKAEAVRESFTGETPAGRVGEGNGEVEWHVDRAAASLLP
ncbi:MAG: 6-phosphogluconolactonase [Acidimicrobiia bacterium]|nr:6-phosphogluconolactonase [Acidimicrobiia bacterium]